MAHIKKLITKEPWKSAVVVPKQSRPKDWTEVTTNVVTDVGAALVGGAGGSFFGYAAVPVGIACSAFGHYFGQRWLTALGIGIIASPFDPGKAAARSANSTGFNLKEEFEAGKERTKDYVEMLKEKFFVNKFFSGKKADQANQSADTSDSPTVNGLEEGVEKATLDRLTEFDQQILSEGIEFQARSNGKPDTGVNSPVNGLDVDIDKLNHIL